MQGTAYFATEEEKIGGRLSKAETVKIAEVELKI
jgi:hypothetical protein